MQRVETGPVSTARIIVPVLFTVTIFISASLLFFVQPLFAKIVLPQIGDAPTVWTTAMRAADLIGAKRAVAGFDFRQRRMIGRQALNVLAEIDVMAARMHMRLGGKFRRQCGGCLGTCLGAQKAG